ncbi:MAG: hypothetical protein JKY56_06190 [Kofleriaceae bacterium]|nr:hypothetical protein [Kofleriaceae bacterium]
MMRPQSVATYMMAMWLLACGDPTIHLPGGDPANCDGVIVGDLCVQPGGSGEGSNWHPDADGDGVVGDSDVCPHIYDPAQSDSDGDGVGDFCDPDFAPPIEGDVVTDLRAEHVTPYGGWFTMRSPQTTQYGKDFFLAWSTSRDDVASGGSVTSLGNDQKREFRNFTYFGNKLLRPEIVTSMEPDTTYYVSVTAIDDNDQLIDQVSNVVEIHTARAPNLSGLAGHPRTMASQEQLDAMRARNDSGDARFSKWKGIMGSAALDAAGNADSEEFELCISAALLFHATGEQRYKDAAGAFIDDMRSYWSSSSLGGNQLRWADSSLAICVDLMWDEMSQSERNTAVDAFLEDDEEVSQDRYADTDEYASIARSWVVDGLVACQASGIDASLSERGCAVLEKGLRSFFGVQLVKARRDQGFFAQSGGNLPDGIGYGWGTSKYWMHTLQALNNVGAGVGEYTTWVWNNFKSLALYSLTPTGRGYATFGDLDAYDNFDIEPNSHPLFYYEAGLVAMQMGLLAQAGLSAESQHAAWHLDQVFPERDYGFSWAILLFDGDDQLRKDNTGLPTSYYDSGMGMFYDRTGWAEDDSYFVFRAGWSGVDHNHEDLGSFQLYRKGVWLTHEALGYDGPSSRAKGHNVPQLEISFEDDGSRIGQFSQDAEGSAPILGVSSSEFHSYVAADLLGAYTSGRYHSFLYQGVERHVLWIKASDANGDDRVFVYDMIDSTVGETGQTRAWQMHLDSGASIDGARAEFSAGDSVQVDLVHPAGLTIEYQASEGSHSNNPGQVYTSRLFADAQSAEEQLRYLSVVRASDSGTSIPNVAVSSPTVVGVLNDGDLVLFPRNANSSDLEELSIDVNGSVNNVWWTGLEHDANYSVSKNGSTYSVRKGGSQTSDAAGVLITGA